MQQFDFIGESRVLLDSIIDDALYCQEMLLTGNITNARVLGDHLS